MRGENIGAAHVLEHSLLMGSRKFPGKFNIARIDKATRTLSYNAMTNRDRTQFYAVTLHPKVG